MNIKNGLGIVVFIGVIAFKIFGGNSGALKFNDKIVARSQQVGTANDLVFTTLAPALEGQTVNVATLKTQQQSARKTIQEAMTEAASLSVPSKPSAKTFFDVYMAHLNNQEKIMNDFDGIVTILEDAAVTADEKSKKIHTMVLTMATVQEADIMRIQQAQKTFAKDCDLKLK